MGEIVTGHYPEHLLVRGDAMRLPFRDQSVSLVFGSPPYTDCRTYLENGNDLGIARDLESWVAWMLAVTTEALRVSRGAVVWVAAGKTEDRNYWPACEMLMADWHRRGGHAYRPCYWHRVGIPGSGGDQWFRADVEYVMCFKRPGKLPWVNPLASGKPLKYPVGGAMSNRQNDGTRVGQFRALSGYKNGDAVYKRRENVVIPEICNPGNIIRTTAGGGHLGNPLAHESEAPFPESLAEHFILSLCPPGGIVLDCFSGSGTAAAVAVRHGRLGIGMDLRQSQCLLAQRRIADGLRPRSKLDPRPFVHATGQRSLFESEAEAP